MLNVIIVVNNFMLSLDSSIFLMFLKNQQQREALLEATEKELDLIVQATQREKRALKGQDKIALRVGKVLNQFKVNKYYNLEITEEGFSYQRKLELIAQETALDGVYVLRTSLESTLMGGMVFKTVLGSFIV